LAPSRVVSSNVIGPLRSHQSERDQSLLFEALDLYWTSPESGATVVQIDGLETDDLGLLQGRVVQNARFRGHKTRINACLFESYITKYILVYEDKRRINTRRVSDTHTAAESAPVRQPRP